MQENKGLIVASCLLWVSGLILACFGKFDIGFLPFLFLFPATLISWIVLFIIAVIRFFLREYVPLRQRLIPFYVLVAPVFFLFTFSTIADEISKKNTWLIIKKYDFEGSENFKFKKDGTYSQWRDSPLGTSAEVSGRYERRDSLITLHPQISNIAQEKTKLVIRPYSEFKKQQSNPIITLVTLDTISRHY